MEGLRGSCLRRSDGGRWKDEGDGRGVVAHGGAEGDEEAAVAGSDDGGGEDDGCLREASLHGGDSAGVVLGRIVGGGDDGYAGAGGERLEHSEDGFGLSAVHGGEVLDLIDDEQGGASRLDVVGQTSHDMAEARPGGGEFRRGGRGLVEQGEHPGPPGDGRRAAEGRAAALEVVRAVLVLVVVLVGRVVGVVVEGVRGGEEVCEVDEVEVRAEEAEDGKDVGLRVAVEGREDDGSGGERGVRLIRGGRAPGDAGGDIEGDGSFAGRRVSGDEGELGEGNAVGPEPVLGLLDEECEWVESGLDRAGGGVEAGTRHEAALREGVPHLTGRAAGTFEREARVLVVGDGKGGHQRVVVARAVDPGAGCAVAAGHAAAEGALYAGKVCRVLRWEGVYVYSVVRHGSGLCSHADMVGRGASGAQRVRVTHSTSMDRMNRIGGTPRGCCALQRGLQPA